MGLVIALGLNPAWQRMLEFERFIPGEVNRAKSVSFCAAGKGVNFARATGIWGKSDCVVVQFAGGQTGRCILREIDAEGMKHITRELEGATRVCTTVLSGAAPRMTELIEPSAAVPASDVAALLKAAQEALRNADALAICGTYPPGVSEDFYGAMAMEAAKLGKPMLVDSVAAIGKVLPHLKNGILKLNLSELKAVTKARTAKSAFKSCLKSFGIPLVAVTDGPRKAFLSDGSALWTYVLPKLSAVQNPIGAGDTCSAVTFSELLAGTPPHEAFALGLSAASASCLVKGCAVYSKAMALEIRAATHVNFERWM